MWLRHIIMRPNSVRRFCIDAFGMVLMLYDTVVIPLQVFSLPETMLVVIMTWVTRVFWTLNIVFDFFTGYLNHKEEFELRPRLIAQNYLSHWFPLDILLVACDWLDVIVSSAEATEQASTARVVKTVRLGRHFRMVRMLRLLKIGAMKEKIQARINSEYSHIIFGIVKWFLGLMMVNHWLACAWYAVSVPTDGWVEYILEHQESNFEYLYTTALHWSLTNLHGSMDVHPANLPERAFSVSVLSLGLVVFSMFLSSITNMTAELQNSYAESTKRRWLLCRFLREHKVSTELAIRVKHYYDKDIKTYQEREKASAFLDELPDTLLRELFYETRGKCLIGHPMLLAFDAHYPQLVRKLCLKTLRPQFISAGETLFTSGDMAKTMLYTTTGSLHYVWIGRNRAASATKHMYQPMPSQRESSRTSLRESKGRSSWARLSRSSGSPRRNSEAKPAERSMGTIQYGLPVQIQNDAWICEPVLWTAWMHRGDAWASVESELLELDCDIFVDIVKANQDVTPMVMEYAKTFVEGLNSIPENQLTDLLLPSDVAPALRTSQQSSGEAQFGRSASVSKDLGAWLRRGSVDSLGSSPLRL
eukprot:gnl/TRDRNA2_/TRDRNA2_77725_c0_seq1.p1 gnl/TRDRNA2_/TRDRNA2_77725_c0~~gnl/TRDRNA2_/TRDRNA2_77725_c0_seq1.p1  ORF type:complete len:604 (-),score=71.09 gnl/TRDRNA2_/TRDRNA2_77725_c0_seq1:157-1920(-)